MYERLKMFVSEQASIDSERINEDSKIEEDLKIYGDDAVELIIAYGKEFNVDVSSFMAADYFSAEGLDILSAMKKIITGRAPLQKKTLTVKHLEKGIIAGRLDEEVINN